MEITTGKKKKKKKIKKKKKKNRTCYLLPPKISMKCAFAWNIQQ